MFGSKKNARRNTRPGRQMLAESLESRRLLTSSMGWDGPGLGTAQLTYHVANAPAGLSQAETNAAIDAALAAWSSVVDIEFTQTDQAGQRDSLDISFAPIDGQGGTLAQAYFPDDVNPARLAGDIQFDTSESWEVGNAAGSRAFDLIYVAVHEIGHALGLDHSDATSSILAPSVSPNQSFRSLSQDDIHEIQSLYAPRISTEFVDSSPTSEATPIPFGPEQISEPNLPNHHHNSPTEPRTWDWFQTTVVVTSFQTNRQPYHWKINWFRSPGDPASAFQVNSAHLYNRFRILELYLPTSRNATDDAAQNDSSSVESTTRSGPDPAATLASRGLARNPLRVLRSFRW